MKAPIPWFSTGLPRGLNGASFSDAVFSVVVSFLADDNGHFVAEVEKVEL